MVLVNLNHCTAVVGILLIISTCNAKPKSPHIVYILADDMGWNDVGFHGSSQVPTPNIDALAYSGIILNRFYVSAICTPSRSALMTGKHPIHTGMQHTVLYAAEPRGLPLNEKILPQHLKGLGYATHIVGKWHLGHFQRVYSPLFRGFDSHLGFWTGHQDYFDHTAEERGEVGLDMRRGMEVAYDLAGKYTTDVIGDESVRLIEAHNASQPLFLYMSHAASHSGNPWNPLPAPAESVKKFVRIKEYNRRRFAAIMMHMDNAIGAVLAALSKRQMLNDSIIIFSTDNGGAAAGFNLNAASNWPLRGVKNTLFEGGVRGAALIWSPLLGKGGRVANQTMHITDWLPTLYRAAGGDPVNLGDKLDGVDMWAALRDDTISPRKEVLHNIDDIYGNAALTVADWKVLKGTTYNGEWDSWYGPEGDRTFDSYNTTELMNSPTGLAMKNLGLMPNVEEIKKIRASASVRCPTRKGRGAQSIQCNLLKKPCLFNIIEDPCEQNNLAEKMPAVLHELLVKLNKYNATAVAPSNLPRDSKAAPRYWNNTWTNFGDYSKTKPNVQLMREKI